MIDVRLNLGVVTDLVSDEFRVFLAGRKDHSRWDVARLGWYADYDDPASFLEVFSQTNSQNDPGYVSPEFNTLIDDARVEPNPDKRIQLLHKSEEILLNDYPIIPVYFYKARRLVKPYQRFLPKSYIFKAFIGRCRMKLPQTSSATFSVRLRRSQRCGVRLSRPRHSPHHRPHSVAVGVSRRPIPTPCAQRSRLRPCVLI